MRFVYHQPGSMPARDPDKGGEDGNIAVHAVMPLDDEERMAVTPARFGQHLVSSIGIEMTERHPARSRQNRPLDDAVVDQRVMNDDVVAPEQVPDHGDVRRVPADQRDAVLRAVYPG